MLIYVGKGLQSVLWVINLSLLCLGGLTVSVLVSHSNYFTIKIKMLNIKLN